MAETDRLTGPARTFEILLVEDNLGDARLTREALRDATVSNRLHHVRDGEEAMRFLTRADPFEDAPRPDIVLLDLNMPRMNGQELLAAMKSKSALRSIPAIVLTTSDADTDIVKSYELQASCYITKPVSSDKFMTTMRQFETFWFAVAQLQ